MVRKASRQTNKRSAPADAPAPDAKAPKARLSQEDLLAEAVEVRP